MTRGWIKSRCSAYYIHREHHLYSSRCYTLSTLSLSRALRGGFYRPVGLSSLNCWALETEGLLGSSKVFVHGAWRDRDTLVQIYTPLVLTNRVFTAHCHHHHYHLSRTLGEDCLCLDRICQQQTVAATHEYAILLVHSPFHEQFGLLNKCDDTDYFSQLFNCALLEFGAKYAQHQTIGIYWWIDNSLVVFSNLFPMLVIIVIVFETLVDIGIALSLQVRYTWCTPVNWQVLWDNISTTSTFYIALVAYQLRHHGVACYIRHMIDDEFSKGQLLNTIYLLNKPD